MKPERSTIGWFEYALIGAVVLMFVTIYKAIFL